MSQKKNKSDKKRKSNVKDGTSEIPISRSHDELRSHLLAMYYRCVINQLPLDSTISYYFRHQKKLAMKARGFLASATYGLLRNRLRLLAILKSCPSVKFSNEEWSGESWSGELLKPEVEALGAIIVFLKDFHESKNETICEVINKACDICEEFPIDEVEIDIHRKLIPVLTKEISEVLEAGFENDSWQKILNETNLTIDLFKRWEVRWGAESINLLTESNQQSAPLDIRTNSAKGERSFIQQKLEDEDLDSIVTPLSPHGLRLQRKGNLFKTNAFQEGYFEVQDLGSQLIGFACNPKPTWRILDACAGGGGKTLHLGALMNNRGEVFAHDISEERLNGLRKRLKRSGLSNIRFVDPMKADEKGPYDLVLIDAPCLGLGTLRRNPDFLWRGKLEDRIVEITKQQRDCLNDYASMVKVGGYLVYATCSFEPEETTDVLAQHELIQSDFKPDPISPHFKYHDIKVSTLDDHSNEVVLAPHTTDTDGFYIARYKRIK